MKLTVETNLERIAAKCCEPPVEERGATEGAAKQKPHATFCGNRGWATGPGDPVAGLRCPAPLTYLRAYDTVAEARTSLARYFGFYNAVSYYPTRLCH